MEHAASVEVRDQGIVCSPWVTPPEEWVVSP